MKGESIIITGVDAARCLASALVGDLVWFSVEPLADERFVFMIRMEDLDLVVARIRERQPSLEKSDHRCECSDSPPPTKADSDK